LRKLFLTLVPLLLLALVGAAPAGAATKGGTGLAEGQVNALLQLQHPGGLNRFVRRVSDPTDPHYRQYATVESLVARYGAKPKAQKRVLNWLAAHGVKATLSPTHTFVIAKLSPHRAARLLPPAPGAIASSVGAGPIARTVPAGLRGSVASVSVTRVAMVTPHDAIGPAPGVEAEGGKEGSGPYGSVLFHTGTASGCEAGRKAQPAPIEPITPNQYLTAYGDTTMHARGLKGEGQSVALVEQGGFKRSDIATYAKCFGVESIPPISSQVVGGGKHPTGEAETTLDLEQLSVTAPGLDHIYVYEAPESLDAIVAAAGEALGDPRHRPDVISISLGVCEPQVVGALAWRSALDNIFAVAGGAGISVLVSSGDQGSSGCRGQNTETEETTALPIQAVSLPSSDPFVTAVGGTNLSLTKQNQIHDEIVWNDSTVRGKPGIPLGRRRWRQHHLAADAVVAGERPRLRPRAQGPGPRRARRSLPRLRLLLHRRLLLQRHRTVPRLGSRRWHQRGDAADRRGHRPRQPSGDEARTAAPRLPQPAALRARRRRPDPQGGLQRRHDRRRQRQPRAEQDRDRQRAGRLLPGPPGLRLGQRLGLAEDPGVQQPRARRLASAGGPAADARRELRPLVEEATAAVAEAGRHRAVEAIAELEVDLAVALFGQFGEGDADLRPAHHVAAAQVGAAVRVGHFFAEAVPVQAVEADRAAAFQQHAGRGMGDVAADDVVDHRRFGFLERRRPRFGDEGRAGRRAARGHPARCLDRAFGAIGGDEGRFDPGAAGVGIFPVAARFDRHRRAGVRFEAAAEPPLEAEAGADDLPRRHFKGDRQPGRGRRVPRPFDRCDRRDGHRFVAARRPAHDAKRKHRPTHKYRHPPH
jgi:Pro-kumamolisin, activation domain